MSFDAFEDVVVSALQVLIKDNVNAALRDVTDDDDAIVTTAGHPLPLSLLVRDELPALAIYRREMRMIPRAHKIDKLATFRFDYIAEVTSRDKIDTRWPMLHAVFDAMLDALDGVHVTPPNPNLLEQAGVVWVGDREARVVFDFLAGDQYSYPSFQAQIPIRYRDLAEGELEPLRELFAQYHLTEPDLGDPDVEQIVELPE